MKTLFNIIDFLAFIALFVNALLYIPQAIKLWKSKKADEISLLTFFGFNLITILLFLHGIIHKDPVIYVGSAITLVTSSIVCYLIIYYRCQKNV